MALADAYDERAALARAEAERWMIGHRTERQVAGTLAPLTACGYTLLHDRGWPGARCGSRAQIDHVLVGPGGVFIVDTKGWRDVTVAGGRIFRGQADVTDDLSGLADVGVGTEGVLAELGLAPGEVHVVVVLAGSAMDPVPLASLGCLVVVTTFVKTLPAVLGSLLHRLAPDVVERVEFTGVHAFAVRVLRERGQRVSLDLAAVNQAFNYAWNRAGRDGPLGSLDSNSRYWRDEIANVIKGHGLSTFEQYADLPRAGRRRPLRLEQRRAVWQLHLAYEAALRETPMQGVDHVIIDEAQDLSCAMLRMLHAIVGDRPDGLTLIGDGQQTIYPGGHSLAEAGISVAGRGVVLATNYRNTREIAAFASAIVEGDEFVDLEGGPGRADAAAEVIRTGPSPALHSFASLASHDAALMSHVRTLVASGVDPGDIGVFTATNRDALALLAALRAAGFGVIELESYSGSPAPLAKVGTIKRAKGLELKQVLLARVDGSLLTPVAEGLDDGATEAREIARREVYVG